MGQMIRTLTQRFGLLILAAAIALLFHYYGALRFKAALLFGLGFAVVGMWLYLLLQNASFKPYKLTIGIDYAALWEDLKLVPAEGPTFENFTFTAISSVLFSRSDERGYSSKLDLYKSIPCGTDIPIDVGGVPGDPTFFLRPANDGYQVGVHVPEGWWAIHRQMLDFRLSELPRAPDGTLTLGVLPYGYMPEHIKRYFKVVSLSHRFDQRQRKWKSK